MLTLTFYQSTINLKRYTDKPYRKDAKILKIKLFEEIYS